MHKDGVMLLLINNNNNHNYDDDIFDKGHKKWASMRVAPLGELI